MTRLEHIAHQPISLTQAKGMVIIDGNDACGVLAAMLQHRQCIIDGLVYRRKTGDTDNTAHVVISSSALPERHGRHMLR